MIEMAELKATQVTKYDAGGSGDNYIADGYIKTVEKVWLDSYTATAIAIGSDDSIKIAVIPANKKITSIEVQLPALNPTSTLATIFIGSAATFLMTSANCYLGSMIPVGSQTGTFASGTAGTMVLLPGKMGTVTDKEVSLYLKIVNTGGADCINTGGTINSIVRYT